MKTNTDRITNTHDWEYQTGDQEKRMNDEIRPQLHRKRRQRHQKFNPDKTKKKRHTRYHGVESEMRNKYEKRSSRPDHSNLKKMRDAIN